jgi:prolyl 4-hydroxylase
MSAMVSADADTQYRTGISILAGNMLAAEWEKAVSLIDAAAAEGHSEALERRALLECRGVGRNADWDNALDTLAIAAERGSQSAAGQLILLADDRYEIVASPEARPGSWTDIRSRIRIAQRVAAPASGGRSLSASPIVHAVKGMASAAECQWLIARAAPRLKRALVYNNPSGVDSGRTNQFTLLNFANADLIAEMIRTRISNELRAPLPCLEISQVLRYEVGEEFVLHCDFLDPQALRDEIARNGQRVATVLIYLNEDFEGGETSFPRLGLNHRGGTGDALVFSNVGPAGKPDDRTQHAGCPPTQGEKWVFSQWVRNRARG